MSNFKKEYIKRKFYLDIPYRPEKFYKKWVNWYDFLGSKITLVNSKIEYKSFEEAKIFIKRFKLKTWKNVFTKSNDRSEERTDGDQMDKTVI